MKREKFGSRLGFILISAGCAIGLGNVWRFPYITGQYGGAAFVLIYLFFLLVLGLPIMVMEFAVGRASQASVALSFDKLEPKGTKWHWYKYFGMAGNYLLMMFYTTIGGWMLLYLCKMVKGEFHGNKCRTDSGDLWRSDGKTGSDDGIHDDRGNFLFQRLQSGCCRKVWRRSRKYMMFLLLALLVVLAIRSATLPGAEKGLSFYLVPDFQKVKDAGVMQVVFAAVGQAFFTLSLGIGAIAIFGSYIDKSRRLMGEAICVTVLDTCVALVAGLIIFPACFAFGVNPDSGPNLIFITLPNIFNAMSGGRIWGSLFFLCMFFAAASTIIAVFENIISFAIDLTGCSRKKAAFCNAAAIILLSMPCILGYNVWSFIQPLGAGSTVLDLEDFLVSNNLLPLGSLVYLAVLYHSLRLGLG